MSPEIAHDQAARHRVASAGAAAVPTLLEGWEGAPGLRRGIMLTLGLLLGSSGTAESPMGREERILACRCLLRGAGAGPDDGDLREGFFEAAALSQDPLWLPLMKRLDPRHPALGLLEGRPQTATALGLVHQLEEVWEALCAEAWVPDAGLSRSAHLAFSSARMALEQGDARTARAALAATGVNIGAARGRGVRSEAYDLIRAGITSVEAALRRCTAPGGAP